MSTTPIADHALISDCRSAAIVDRAGSVEWLCWPRIDAPSVFGRLLDEGAGHWSLAPSTDATVARRYVDRTMVLETTFTTATGVVTVTDALATGAGERGHELGHRSPRLLVRRVTGVAGRVDVAFDLAPRPEYGLITPVAETVDGTVRLQGGPDVMVLSTPVPVTVADGHVTTRFTVAEGDTVTFGLHHRRTEEPAPRHWTQAELGRRLDGTVTTWRSWARLHQRYEGPWRHQVHHSGRVLQALTFAPTGAIAAAATTSLPESIGGARNWDYRYSWVRDASFTVDALWVAACPDEADAFFTYMATSAAAQVRQGGDLQIMFGVGGEHDLTERELPHLKGWRDSAPVSVGNGAWDQRQLDVYGELLNAAARLPEIVDRCPAATKTFLADIADVAAARWTETDQGIWETRGGAQHFLYSKLMCWVALDRAIALADLLGVADRVGRWKPVRDELAEAILTRGWSDSAQAFTQAFDSDHLDASALMMPIVGFIDPRDPRMVATLDAIEERLTDQRGLVFRYLAPDGLAGDEGTFLLCTFWLAQARALAGQVDQATTLFERALAFSNDVGLLAEEVDPATGELLGNFPQAFSHIGLINAAWAISQAIPLREMVWMDQELPRNDPPSSETAPS
jgi:GH15 family glucan-1,4-alpha-glucosidase